MKASVGILGIGCFSVVGTTRFQALLQFPSGPAQHCWMPGRDNRMARRGLLDGPVGPTRECWMARRGLLDGWVGVAPALLNGRAGTVAYPGRVAPR